MRRRELLETCACVYVCVCVCVCMWFWRSGLRRRELLETCMRMHVYMRVCTCTCGEHAHMHSSCEALLFETACLPWPATVDAYMHMHIWGACTYALIV